MKIRNFLNIITSRLILQRQLLTTDISGINICKILCRLVLKVNIMYIWNEVECFLFCFFCMNSIRVFRVGNLKARNTICTNIHFHLIPLKLILYIIIYDYDFIRVINSKINLCCSKSK